MGFRQRSRDASTFRVSCLTLTPEKRKIFFAFEHEPEEIQNIKIELISENDLRYLRVITDLNSTTQIMTI